MRSIDADALKNVLKEMWEEYKYIFDLDGAVAFILAKKAVDQQPELDQECIRPHGKWIRIGEMAFQCSECKIHINLLNYPHCPYCGAIMDRKDNEKEEM